MEKKTLGIEEVDLSVGGDLEGLEVVFGEVGEEDGGDEDAGELIVAVDGSGEGDEVLVAVAGLGGEGGLTK